MNQTRLISLGLISVALAGAGLLAFSTRPAAGVMQAAPAVAGVDVVKVFNEYERQKDLTGQMEKIQSTLDAENNARRQRIDALQQAITTMQPTDPTYNARREELLHMQIEYKNWVDLKQAQMAREVSRWSGRVYQEILDAVQQVAQQSGVEMVIYKDEFIPQLDNPDAMREQIRMRKMLYCSSTADLTQQVLGRLNQNYRSQPKMQMIDIKP